MPTAIPDLAALAPEVAAADPDRCLTLLRLLGRGLKVLDPEAAVSRVLSDHIPDGSDLTVVAIGKAAPAMARGAATSLGNRVRRWLVVSDHNEPVPEGAELLVTAHPLPDRSSLEAGARLLALVSHRADHVIFLVSGGGSALAEVPKGEVSLGDLVTTYDLLLTNGVPIEAANIVRSHLSAIKGGKLAAAVAAPATTVVLSDVGPRLDLVASGPSIPSPTRPSDSLAVLREYGLLERMPASVISVLEGEVAPVPDIPGEVLSAGDGATAARAVAAAGRRLGVSVSVVTTSLEGEAAEVARWALEVVPEGDVGVLAGETTVTVRGSGRGGRNQEAALAAALEMEHGAFVTFGTDGVDGPTDAAGAYVDTNTADTIRAAGIDPTSALRDNDSHTALSAATALLRTGPTGINVADLWLVDKRQDRR